MDLNACNTRTVLVILKVSELNNRFVEAHFNRLHKATNTIGDPKLAGVKCITDFITALIGVCFMNVMYCAC